MGNKLCRCCRNPRKADSARQITLAAFGLDNAGKTSVVKAIKGDSLADVAPTVGFASNKFKHDKYDVTLYDVGGGSRIRGIWKNYFAEIHGIIYVIDSSDKNRIEENHTEMQKLLSNPRIQGKPLLLLLNKRDIAGSMDENDVKENLNLEKMVNDNKCLCKVEQCSASKGVGKLADANLKNGFEWLIADILRDYEMLDKKIQSDLNERKAELEKEKELRMERIKKAKAERGELDDGEELPGQTDEQNNEKLNEKIDDESSSPDEPEIKNDRLPPVVKNPTANGDARHRRKLTGGVEGMGQNGAFLGSRHPSWRNSSADADDDAPVTSVPTLPPISLSPAVGGGSRVAPAAPPPSRIEISRQRRISVESVNQNLIADTLPVVHAQRQPSRHHVAMGNGHVPVNRDYEHSTQESAHSADSSSTNELTKFEVNNPRKRRRQKRLGRFNKTVPAISTDGPLTGGGDSVESGHSLTSQQQPPLAPRLPVETSGNPTNATDNDLIIVNQRLEDLSKSRRRHSSLSVDGADDKLPPVQSNASPRLARIDKEIALRLNHNNQLEDITESNVDDNRDFAYHSLSLNDNTGGVESPRRLSDAADNVASPRIRKSGADNEASLPPPPPYPRHLPNLHNPPGRRLERIELPNINSHRISHENPESAGRGDDFEMNEKRHSLDVRRQSNDSAAPQSKWGFAEDL